MAKSLFTQWRLSPENFAANTTLYVAPAGGSVENESGIGGADRPLRQAGTAANLRVKIENNGVTAASTFTLMDSQVATSVVVAISASTNGDIEDTSNTAALVASDEITLRMATGSSGTSLDLVH